MKGYLSWLTCGTLAVCLSSCASHAKKDDQQVGVRAHDDYSIANASLKKAQLGISSPLEKKVFNANHAFGGASTNSSFHTKMFGGGNKSFGGGDTAYGTKAFAMSNKQNSNQTKMFASSDKKSNFGNKTFSTSDSRYNKETNQNEGKMFSGSDNVFKTNDFYQASKSITKNTRPKITDDGGKTLSEAEVQRLLNK